MLPKRIMRSITCELGSGLDGLLDALDRQPTKVGAESFKVGSSLGNGALMNATFQEIIRHIVADFTLLAFGSTLMDDEVINILSIHSPMSLT